MATLQTLNSALPMGGIERYLHSDAAESKLFNLAYMMLIQLQRRHCQYTVTSTYVSV